MADDRTGDSQGQGAGRRLVDPPVLLAALRRFTLLLAVSAGLTAGISLLFGLLAGSSASKSVAIGLYLVGSFLLVAGFFVGNRGPVRTKRDSGMTSLFGSRFVRWATPEEREETINMSAVYVCIGFVLIILGVAADSRYKLF